MFMCFQTLAPTRPHRVGGFSNRASGTSDPKSVARVSSSHVVFKTQVEVMIYKLFSLWGCGGTHFRVSWDQHTVVCLYGVSIIQWPSCMALFVIVLAKPN